MAAISPQLDRSGTTQYGFLNWSDGGAQAHTITVGTSGASFTANFNTQYLLTTSASPAAGGSISPASGWYLAGSSMSVSATANAGYLFTSFTGALQGPTTPQMLTMNGPATVTAIFGLAITGQVIVGGVPTQGVTVALSGSASSSTTTDVNGNYAFTNLASGNYTVTPTSGSLVFCPTSATFNNLVAPQTANFTSGGPTREYIRLGTQVIAIANCGAP
jgi:hypothetical protein